MDASSLKFRNSKIIFFGINLDQWWGGWMLADISRLIFID